MLDQAHQKDLVKRLNRVEGQVRGIKKMVEQPRLCVEILQQLAAAEAALRQVSAAVFKYHVRRCVPADVREKGVKPIEGLAELVDMFDRFRL